ncbi:MAG: hypothetical protein ACRECR_07600, partial [Thermoplasmata archaeon]
MVVSPDEEPGIGLLGPESRSPPPEHPPLRPAEAPSASPAPLPVAPVRPEAIGPVSLRAADEVERTTTASTVTTLSCVIESSSPEPVGCEVTAEVTYTSTYPGEGAEWPVKWLVPGKRSYVELVRRPERFRVTLSPRTAVPLSFEVQAPVGVRYGDRVEVKLAASAGEESKPARLTLAWTARQAVLAIKSSRGYEREVADTLLSR